MPIYTGHLPAASNRADFIFQVKLSDLTNTLLDLTGTAITVSLRYAGQYGSSPVLVGSTTDGHVTILGPGLFDVHFLRSEMTQFPPGDLDMGITMMLSTGETYQLFSGQVPVIDGVVAA